MYHTSVHNISGMQLHNMHILCTMRLHCAHHIVSTCCRPAGHMDTGLVKNGDGRRWEVEHINVFGLVFQKMCRVGCDHLFPHLICCITHEGNCSCGHPLTAHESLEMKCDAHMHVHDLIMCVLNLTSHVSNLICLYP